MRSSYLLTVFAAAALLGCAFASSDCSFDVDFFARPNDTASCGQNCAFPYGWTKVNQTAAGNTASNELYTIAFSTDQYGRNTLNLFFAPVWYALWRPEGEDVSSCFPASPAPTRKLLASTVNVTQNGTVGAVSYTLNDGVPIPLTESNTHAYAITVQRDQLQEGLNTFNISVTLNANSGRVEFANGTQQSVPPTSQTIHKVVQLWFRDAQAAANFTLSKMCNTTVLKLNASDIAPMPLALSSSGQPVAGKYVFTPMVTVWGKKVSEIDGSPAPDELDAAKTSFVNNARKYFVMPTSQDPDNNTIVAIVSADLQEGFYEFNATVSVLSESKALLNLNGVNQINQVDDNTVSNKFEAMKAPTKTMTVGVQRTPTYLSAISADRTGMLVTGDKLNLKWTFRGIGDYTCTHDGEPVPACKSPYALTVLDVATEDKEHTFVVSFKDVCGQEEVARFKYTQKGVQAVTQPNLPSSLTGLPSTGAGSALTMNNSALSRTALTSLASAAAVAVLLPVLL